MDGLHGVDQRAFDGLLDPPGSIGAEARALLRIEPLDRAQQSEIALLDEVAERHAAIGIILSDVDDESQIGSDHSITGPLRFRFDLLFLDQRRPSFGEKLVELDRSLDDLAQLPFFLRREQRRLVDLLEVVL